MPKMKTHSGAKKRFRVTGSGHVKFKRAGMRHIQAKISATFVRVHSSRRSIPITSSVCL